MDAGPKAALEKLLKPLSKEMSADLAKALIDLQADGELQARYDELAGKCSEGLLTSEESN